MFKLALNAGHYNGTTRGIPASLSPNNHPNEWVLNERVVDAVIARLKKYSGIEVLQVNDPKGEKYLDLIDLTNKANAWGADFYLAVHHNGGINGGTGGGIVAFTYLTPTATEKAWQKELYDALIAKTGLRGDRATPLAKQDLHEVREPKMDAVLLELGFMDSRNDIKTILAADFADKCADAIVSVIVKRAGLKEREEVFKKGETSLGIYAMKRLLMLAKAFSLVPSNAADDGGYGDGTDKDVKAIQKLAGLTQKTEANEATIRAIYVQTLDALNAERKKTAATLKAAQDAEKKNADAYAKTKAQLAAVQKKLDEIGRTVDVNGDGKVNTKDLLALRKMLSE